eukprot:SM000177S03199  [mRNA]  locus=s177:281718:288960:+ [translate_table: standard]
MSRASPALCRDFQRGRCWPLPPTPPARAAGRGGEAAPLPPPLQLWASRVLLPPRLLLSRLAAEPPPLPAPPAVPCPPPAADTAPAASSPTPCLSLQPPPRPSCPRGARAAHLAAATMCSRLLPPPAHRQPLCGNPSLCKQQINEDEINEKPTWWRLTCYAHWKELPNDVVGDVSSEELRAEAYSAARQGVPLADLVHRERTMFRAKETIFEQLGRSPYTGPAKPLGAGPLFPPLGGGGMDPFPKSPTNVQGPMLFGQPVTDQGWSAFGVPRAAPFGSTFGPQGGPISSGPPPVVGIPQGNLFGSFSSSSLPSSGSSFPADLTTSGQLGGSPLLFGREGIAGHHGTSTSAFSSFGRLIATTPEAMQPMQSPHELHSASSGGIVELTPASSAISLDAGSGDVWRSDKWMLGQVIKSAGTARVSQRVIICNTIISQGLEARARRGSGLSTIMTVSQAVALVAEEVYKSTKSGAHDYAAKSQRLDEGSPLTPDITVGMMAIQVWPEHGAFNWWQTAAAASVVAGAFSPAFLQQNILRLDVSMNKSCPLQQCQSAQQLDCYFPYVVDRIDNEFCIQRGRWQIGLVVKERLSSTPYTVEYYENIDDPEASLVKGPTDAGAVQATAQPRTSAPSPPADDLQEAVMELLQDQASVPAEREGCKKADDVGGVERVTGVEIPQEASFLEPDLPVVRVQGLDHHRRACRAQDIQGLHCERGRGRASRSPCLAEDGLCASSGDAARQAGSGLAEAACAGTRGGVVRRQGSTLKRTAEEPSARVWRKR